MLALLGGLVAVLLALPLALYLGQERLIFHPQALSERARAEVSALPRVEELRLDADEGISLHGWFRRAARDDPGPLVLYFGGNAEEVSWLAAEFGLADDHALALVNYRGYGLSEGAPSEAALFADAERIYDAMAARPDVDPAGVVAFGRSLGSGVAVHLATVRPLRAVVLVSPYDSVRAIAHSRYPFVPVDLLLQHPFDSLARAGSIRQPVLIVAAAQDRTIEPARSRRLLEAWGGRRDWALLPGVDHNSVASHPEYWPRIEAFLRRGEGG